MGELRDFFEHSICKVKLNPGEIPCIYLWQDLNLFIFMWFQPIDVDAMMGILNSMLIAISSNLLAINAKILKKLKLTQMLFALLVLCPS